MPQRAVFYVSDDTGVTAEHLGRSLLSQFRERVEFRPVTLPFVSTPDKASCCRRAHQPGSAGGWYSAYRLRHPGRRHRSGDRADIATAC